MRRHLYESTLHYRTQKSTAKAQSSGPSKKKQTKKIHQQTLAEAIRALRKQSVTNFAIGVRSKRLGLLYLQSAPLALTDYLQITYRLLTDYLQITSERSAVLGPYIRIT